MRRLTKMGLSLSGIRDCLALTATTSRMLWGTRQTSDIARKMTPAREEILLYVVACICFIFLQLTKNIKSFPGEPLANDGREVEEKNCSDGRQSEADKNPEEGGTDEETFLAAAPQATLLLLDLRMVLVSSSGLMIRIWTNR